jgi:hypothetical protein
MAANTNPIFNLVGVAKSVTVSSATTDSPLRAGTGANFGTIVSAASNGTRIERVTARATGQVAATQVLLFLYDGSTSFFWLEGTLAAATASSTVAGSSVEFVRTDGLPLVTIPSGYSLKCALSVTTTSGVVVVTAFGGDL